MSDEPRGILVVGELKAGALRKCTLELLGKARELADNLGARITCVLIDEGAGEVAEKAIHHGADKVLFANVAHTGFQAAPLVGPLLRIVRDENPEILLFSATDLGRDLAPMVGARLGTGVANECVDLGLDPSTRQLLAKRYIFGEQLVETQVTPTARPQIASLRPGAAREGFPDEHRFGDTEEVEVAPDVGAEVLEIVEGTLPGLDDADVVIVGGRGVGEEHWPKLEALAQSLGAAVGATRGAVHGGLAAEQAQVGATGHWIKPRLYLGFGVAGAFEHQLGIQGAEWVVAINRDKEAPLIERADWALIGDAAAIADQLKAAVEKRRS